MSAHLVLLYLGLLKQENYKELIDSIDLYELLGVSSGASKEEIDKNYKNIKEKIKPETFPNINLNKERFEYLLGKIDKAYQTLIIGDFSKVKKEGFVFEPISEMEEPEFRPGPYVPYMPPLKNDFISEATRPQIEEVERIVPQYESNFISQAPYRETSNQQVAAYQSDEIFTAGTDIANSFVSVPISEIDKLSSDIIDAIMENMLKGVMMRTPEMLQKISEVLMSYSKRKTEDVKPKK